MSLGVRTNERLTVPPGLLQLLYVSDLNYSSAIKRRESVFFCFVTG